MKISQSECFATQSYYAVNYTIKQPTSVNHHPSAKAPKLYIDFLISRKILRAFSDLHRALIYYPNFNT